MTVSSRSSGIAEGLRSEAEMLREVGFWTILREDVRQHRGQWSRPGLQALLVHRIGAQTWNWKRPWRYGLVLLYYVGHAICRNIYGIELTRSVQVGRRFEIGHQHGIVIHQHARIGDDCVVRQGVTFGVRASRADRPGEGPVIGNNVSFGVGSVVIGAVRIGDNVSIGPNCVISADVPANRSLFVPPPRALPKAEEPGPEGPTPAAASPVDTDRTEESP